MSRSNAEPARRGNGAGPAASPPGLDYSAELLHGVLVRVAEFLRKLRPDQLESLAAGTARLEIAGRSSRPAKRSATTPAGLPKPAEEIGGALADFAERAPATAYLDGMNLTGTQLRALAAALGIAVPSKATKAQTRDTIVQWTVGRRADTRVISRPARR